MGAGEARALPTATELAELYNEWDLDQLISLAGDVDDHAALVVLCDARRMKMRARLAAALNLTVVREERERMYAAKLEAEQEYALSRAAMRQAAADMPVGTLLVGSAGFARPSDVCGQSAAPSE